MESNKHYCRLKAIHFLLLFIIPICTISQVKPNSVEKTQLYPVKENDNYGYINKLGKIIIKPQFQDAKDFNGGFAIIKISGKYGIINTNGTIIVNPIFEDLQNFSGGLARFKSDGKYGFIDNKGKVVIKPQFDDVWSFSNGLAQIKIGGKFGFINLKGEIVTNPEIDEISSFSDGLAKIKIGDKYGFINLNGKIVIKPKFFSADFFSEGLSRAATEEDWPWTNNSGYIDKTGNYVIQPQFGFQSGYFKDGIAPASVNRKFGYINKKGEFIITPQFTCAFEFNEGLAWVSYSEEGGGCGINPDAKWGCIDKTGKFVINPQDFFWPGNFSEGLCYVNQKKVDGGLTDFFYIDKTGSPIIKLGFSYAHNFHNGWADVKLKDRWGVVNKQGIFYYGTLVGDLIRCPEGDDFYYIDKKGNSIWH